MDKTKYINLIQKYLKSNLWNSQVINEETWFEKNTGIISPKSSKFIPLKDVYSILLNQISRLNKSEMHFDSIINPYSDTDFIIAGLQLLNVLLEKEDSKRELSLYSFQPVIRTIPKGKEAVAGFLPCFVNLSFIKFDTTITGYFEELENCITMLSKCHIHASTIRLKIKYNTNAYNGIGLKLYIGEEEIGQCNLYEMDFHERKILVSDFGFGLERICWAANGYAFFDAIYQSYTNYGLKIGDYSRQMSLIVLMLICGIKPNSTKYGLQLRKLFEKYNSFYGMWEYSDTLLYYFNYWSLFLNCKCTLDEIKCIFAKEIQYQRALKIVRDSGASLSDKLKKKPLDEIVYKMIQFHVFDESERC